MEKNIYVVKGRKSMRFSYDADTWGRLLNASCAQAVKTREYYRETFFGNYHVLYGYAMPNVGKYTLCTSTFTDEAFGQLVKDLEAQDKEVLIYALHS